MPKKSQDGRNKVGKTITKNNVIVNLIQLT